MIFKKNLSMVLGFVCFSLLVSFSIASFADTKEGNGWLAGKWVVVASPSSLSPTIDRDSWEWLKLHGRRFSLIPRISGFPFASDKCLHPLYSRKTMDATTFYQTERIPLEALGIDRAKVNVVDISCDRGKWGLTGVMRVAEGIIVAGVPDGGYILAVRDSLLSGAVTPVDKSCKRLVGFMDKYKQDRRKLMAAGCWNVAGAMVYAWAWRKKSGRESTRVLIATHGVVYSLLIRNQLADMWECAKLPTIVPSQHAKKTTLASAHGLIKDLECQASCRLAGFGPLQATVEWAECSSGKAAFRICKGSWKSARSSHSFNLLIRK